MKKMLGTLKGLILATAMIAVAALPGEVLADAGSGNQADSISWNTLSFEEIGAGATPLTGTTSVSDYHARELIMWSSPVALDINLHPIGQTSLMAAVTKN